MNKSELSRKVADETGMTQADSARAVDATLEAIKSALCKHEQVTLAGFGTFLAKTRAEREGRNPSTGAKITIPKRTSAAFKPASVLKDL